MTQPSISRDDYRSPRLIEFVSYYSNRMSYEEVATLVERVSGQRLLSDQGIWQIVQRKAQMISQQWQTQLEFSETLSQSTPEIATVDQVDLYDPSQSEVLIFEDAIGVKRQSPTRRRTSGEDEPGFADEKVAVATTEPATVTTDVVMLQTNLPDQFEYWVTPLLPPEDPHIPLSTWVSYRMKSIYGHEKTEVAVVAISDGAQVIRRHLTEMFGQPVPLILDWYHLVKRVREYLSMFGLSKANRLTLLATLVRQLWNGQTQEVMDSLKAQTPPRSEKRDELVNYLRKHQGEIINYAKRKSMGKTIGSGRMEKAVDQVIGRRQKRKGCSWRPHGSHALAILKVTELNHRWHQAFFQDVS